jgi:hypothetical protein
MNHEQAERLLSARIDGERLSARAGTSLERHLQGCSACRAFERGAYRLRESARFELAPAVPDLVEPILAAVRTEPRRPGAVRRFGPERRRRARRFAPALAALLVGALAGSLIVGGPWHERPGAPALAATEVIEGIAAAAVHLDAYQATFALTEAHLAPDVPVRELTMRVWFGAPERFRLDVVDHTDYPTETTPTDLRLVVNGSDWYAAGPAPCPTATCPRRESVVRNRLPFSTAAPIPTDLVLPLSTLADAEGVEVLGRGDVLGRAAVRVEVPFERARPLFPFLEIGGEWRPFFPHDRVRIWLDERSWLPLRWEVFPAAGPEREAWALRFGLPEEPPGTPIFSATALDVSLAAPEPGVFRIPATAVASDQGGRDVALADVASEAGFQPVAPPSVAGLDLYRVVLTSATAAALVSYADGLSYLNLGETRSWRGEAPYGPVGAHAEEVALPGGGFAYFEPATSANGRRLSIHAADLDLYLESNLPRAEVLAAASSLPVRGVRMPESWRVRELAGEFAERVTLEQARAAVPFAIALPRTLPPGFGLASVELAIDGPGPAVTVYLRALDADPGIGTIRYHLEEAGALPPATSAAQVGLRVGGIRARFTPERSQLEWVAAGLYRSIDAPGLSLPELVAIATSIEPGGSR